MKIIRLKRLCSVTFEVIISSVLFLLFFVIYIRHLNFELPNHPTIDEMIIIDGIQRLIDEGVSATLPFNYPHLSFWIGYVAYKFCFHLFDISPDYFVYFIRVVICGFGFLSNIFIYIGIKKLTGNSKIASIAFLVSIISLYQYEYFYYVGPDATLFGVANLVYCLVCYMLAADNEKTIYYYPLMGMLIGLAVSAKYHGAVLGIMWLLIHIRRKMYKNARANVIFVLSCGIALAVFILIDWKMLFDFNDFRNQFLWNFSHYSTGHQGIETNCSFLAYIEAWMLYPLGFLGGGISLLGLYHLFKIRKYTYIALIMSVPTVILALLSRSTIGLGRNVGLIMPSFYLLVTAGIVFLWQYKKVIGRCLVVTWISVMIPLNTIYMCYFDSYCDSYDYVEEWIEDTIPSGASIYLDKYYYAPVVDITKYNVILVEEPTDGLPDLKHGEFYVTMGLTYDRYFQKKDWYFCDGDYMYPDDVETYEQWKSKYVKILDLKAVSQRFDSKFRASYIDLLKNNHRLCFKGCNVSVYTLQ